MGISVLQPIYLWMILFSPLLVVLAIWAARSRTSIVSSLHLWKIATAQKPVRFVLVVRNLRIALYGLLPILLALALSEVLVIPEKNAKSVPSEVSTEADNVHGLERKRKDISFYITNFDGAGVLRDAFTAAGAKRVDDATAAELIIAEKIDGRWRNSGVNIILYGVTGGSAAGMTVFDEMVRGRVVVCDKSLPLFCAENLYGHQYPKVYLPDGATILITASDVSSTPVVAYWRKDGGCHAYLAKAPRQWLESPALAVVAYSLVDNILAEAGEQNGAIRESGVKAGGSINLSIIFYVFSVSVAVAILLLEYSDFRCNRKNMT